MLYGATEAQATSTSDDDGDGLNNADEIAAGTNPFVPNSTLRVVQTTSTATTVSITFATVSQKLYILQASTALAPTNWHVVQPGVLQVTGDGTNKTLVAQKSDGPFFRVLVQDLDSDGDNVSDWVELVLGYNPTAVMTNGLVNDFAALNGSLPGQNIVKLSASEPATTQPSENVVPLVGLGAITITRSNDLLFSSITVPLVKSGSAVEGKDYLNVPSSITLPANVASVTVYVTPLYNPARTTSATLTLTAQAGGGYTLGAPNSASIIIYPSGSPVGTGLSGAYYASSNSTYRHAANVGGAIATYSYTRNAGLTDGTINVRHGGLAPVTVGSTVHLSFTSGTLIGPLYDKGYTVTAAPALLQPAVTFTLNSATINSTAHGLTLNTPVTFTTTGALPTNFTQNTIYYVISGGLTANAFQVSTSIGGTAVTPTTSQSGTHTARASNFTVAIAGTATLPTSDTAGNGLCFISAVNAPFVTRLDPVVDFNWRIGVPTTTTLPTAGNDNWAGRFDGYLEIPTTGNYQFDVQADDSARVYVDLNGNGTIESPAERVIEAWAPGSSTFTPMASAAVALAATTSPGTRVLVRVEFMELNQNATLNLRWKKPGDASFLSIPTGNVFLDAAGSVNRWLSLYWTNTDFIGLPRFAEYRTGITSLNWTTNQPSQTLPNNDNYSGRWEGWVSPTANSTTASYLFDLQGDDGARALIDFNGDGDYLDAGETIIDAWSSTALTESAAITNAQLAPGQRYKLRVEFRETTGNSLVKFRWKKTGGTYANINASTVSTTADVLNLYRESTGATTGWWSTFFDNAAVTDPPLYSAQDTSSASINNDYTTTKPGGSNLGTSGSDNWSGLFAGYLNPSATGNFTFTVNADDGARVYLDLNSDGDFLDAGEMIIDAWTGFTNIDATSAVVPLTQNVLVPIRVEFYELTSNVKAILQWTPPSSSKATIPAGNFFRNNNLVTPGLTGIYWTNVGMNGPSSFVDYPTQINYNPGTSQPNLTLTQTEFSAAWEGFLLPSSTGNFLFEIQADEKAKVYVNSLAVPVIDAWATNSSTVTPMQSAAVPLTAGVRVPIKIEFADTTGDASIILRWRPPTASSFVGIPNTNLFRDATTSQWGLLATYYSNSALTPPFSYQVAENNNPAVTYTFGSGYPVTGMSQDNYSIRWSGQVLPQYSETYFFVARNDDGARLWVNNQLIATRWPGSTVTDTIGSIALQAGVRYDIVLEYYEATGAAESHLQWYSESQPKEVIPTGRLFPTSSTSTPIALATATIGGGTAGSNTLILNSLTGIGLGQVVNGTNIPIGSIVTGINTATNTITLNTTIGTPVANGTSLSFSSLAAPPTITSPTSAVALLGGTPFSYTITASNGGGSFTANGPAVIGSPSAAPNAWLTLTNGVLSGTAPVAGKSQFTISATNAAGTTSSVVDLEVLAAGGKVTRDLWTSVTGFATFASNPNSSADVTVAALEDNADYADGSGQRLRGYIIPPTTGNYYFSLAANNAAQLWISNDSEPVNKVLRATVAASVTQKSPWLAMVGGRKYYFEVLHIPSGGGADNVAVSYFLDPTGITASPAFATIPSYMLSPFDNPPTIAVSGKIYISELSPPTGVVTTAIGGAYVRLNTAENQAVIHFSRSGLTSGELINVNGLYVSPTNTPVFNVGDTDKFHPELKTTDGGYNWNLSAQNVTDLKNGRIYFKIATQNNPNGELVGTLGYVPGSQTAPAVPSMPPWSDDSDQDGGAARFLIQATYGPSQTDIDTLNALAVHPSFGFRYRTWIENQFGLGTVSRLVPDVLTNLSANPMFPYPKELIFNSWWKNSVTAPDQLRHRVAFALSEIMVVSNRGPLEDNARILADYYDVLLDNAFGNFRDLLEAVTLTPAMGIYLDMRGNQRGDIPSGRIPNENYAREILQLFSIGLYRLWPDGSLVLDSNGNPIATYDQDVVKGFARVFTGWNYGQPLQGNGRLPTSFGPTVNYLDPMILTPAQHELGSKLLLDNVVLPPADANESNLNTVVNGPAYNVKSVNAGLGQGNLVTTPITNVYDAYGLKGLKFTHDQIRDNSAVGPLVCRQLIQRLVTNHPTQDYVHRVVRAFNGEGNVDGIATGVRGDMKDVIRAILLDYEARSLDASNVTTFGKQREPLLRVTGTARAFPPTTLSGSYAQAEYSNAPTNSLNSDTMQLLTITSTNHRLNNGDAVQLTFSNPTTGLVPTSKNYIARNITTNTFQVNPTGIQANGDPNTNFQWTQSGTIVTVTASGYVANNKVYLKFVKNGNLGANLTPSAPGTGVNDLPPDGIYTIATATGSTFTVDVGGTGVTRSSTANRLLIPRFGGGYSISANPGQSAPFDKLITVATSGNHELLVNQTVQLVFPTGIDPAPPANGVYTVRSIVDDDHFTVWGTNANDTNQPNLNIFPLVKPQMTRAGSVGVQQSTFLMGSTDGELVQSPLNSPTVFNFFYPDFQYPGPTAVANPAGTPPFLTLASYGLTTPEFQLTTDTNVMNLQNFFYGAIHTTNNTSGFLSFKSGNGSIAFDLGPYLTDALTADGAIAGLIDSLSTVLNGRTLATTARDGLATYVKSKTIASIGTSSPYTITTLEDHGFATGDIVTISGVSGGTFTGTINTTKTVTVTGAKTFTTTGFTYTGGASFTSARVGFFPFATLATPTITEKRNRVRAIVYMLTSSPDFAIQK